MATREAPERQEGDARKARVDGFDLHADVAVSRRYRQRLECLCRYILRPPVSEPRLQLLKSGRVLLQLKSQRRDGTTHVSFEGEAFIERLATLVPRPQANTVIYHGVLAANAKWRRRVVPPPKK